MFVKYWNIAYIYFGDPIQLEGMISKEVDSPSTPFAHAIVLGGWCEWKNAIWLHHFQLSIYIPAYYLHSIHSLWNFNPYHSILWRNL